MKKLLLKNFVFIFTVFIFSSCSQDNSTFQGVQNDNLEEYIKSRYNLVKLPEEELNDLDINASGFNEVEVYQSPESDAQFVLYLNNSQAKYKVEEIQRDNNGVITYKKEISFKGEIIDNIMEFEDLKITEEILNDSNVGAKDSTPKKTLCQREGNESTSDCYKREVDEFCDNFVNCFVLVVNPQVHLLILALCTC